MEVVRDVENICTVSGKAILPDREAAKAAAKSLRIQYHGRGKAYRCAFGEHYHVTKSVMGSSGRRGGK